jgi:hypothetical protein
MIYLMDNVYLIVVSATNKYLLSRNKTCLNRCPSSTAVFSEENKCVNYCPGGTGLNYTHVYNISQDIIQSMNYENSDYVNLWNSNSLLWICSPCNKTCKECSPLNN